MDRSRPPRRDIAEFLVQFRTAVDYGRRAMRDRQKNTQGIIDLGIDKSQAWDIVKRLAVEDYVAGPMPDETDSEKEVWVFGQEIDGTEAYIKLRLAPVKGKQTVQHALIWSFHPADYPMVYPFQKDAK